MLVIPDYGLWRPVRLDGFVQDAAHAVAWTHAHASECDRDPSSLLLMVHSAGAHIGALFATDGHWLAGVGMHPRQLAGFIGLTGPYDFLPLKDPDFIDMFSSTHQAQQCSQPVHFVSGDEPAVLLMQGSADKMGAAAQRHITRRDNAARRRVGRGEDLSGRRPRRHPVGEVAAVSRKDAGAG